MQIFLSESAVDDDGQDKEKPLRLRAAVQFVACV
jgi:hypothetical protein